MGFNDYLRFVLALAFVLSLMGIIAQLMKRSGWGQSAGGGTRGKRLTVLEIRNIDTRHKIALVKCDDREHLVVLGPNGQSVIDTNVQPQKAAL